MLTIQEAWARLTPHLAPLPSTFVQRSESSGRVLDQDLAAALDVPPCDVSAMDGFAIPKGMPPVDSSDWAIGPTIAAGDAPGLLIAEMSKSGEPLVIPRIMTGAPVPEDCDRVIPVERATVPSRNQSSATSLRVRFAPESSVQSGQHIRRRGEVSKVGQPLLLAGQRISAATTSLLATHGLDQLPVHRRATVAFATTGSEIVPPSSQPGPGQIRDSHSAFFQSALSCLTESHTSLGIVEDDPATLRRVIDEGLKSDVLLLSGGVSMGEFDLVEGVLEEAGCELLFDAVAIQPGKPLVAAKHQDGLVFGLPGNPASAQVTFWLFVEPALRRLAGEDTHPWGNALSADLVAPLRGARDRDRFLPCILRRNQGQLTAEPIVPRGSHDVAAYGLVNGLVRVSAGQPPKPSGETCTVVSLP